MSLLFNSSANGFGSYRDTDLIIIDVSWVAQRHAHALGRRFNTSDGRMSGHIFGAFRDIRSLIYTLNPTRLVFAYDRGHQWRTDLVPSYKEKRKPKEAPLTEIDPAADLERLFRFFPGIHLSMDGFEADDMAGWYCHQHDGESPLSIYTKDRDIWQLVNDEQQISCLMPVKKKPRSRSTLTWVDEDLVVEDFGVSPGKIPMAKALLGDRSDGIKGLAGAKKPGKKKALADFIDSPDADPYFDPSNTVISLGSVPDFLSDALLSERRRILDNYKVVNIAHAVERISGDPSTETPSDMMGAMDVLVEYECDSLVAMVKPLFDHLDQTT